MSLMKIAFGNFRNDSASSDGRLVLITQIILILFLSTLSLTSATVQGFLNNNLNNMLGADLSVSGNRALSNADENYLSRNSAGMSKVQLIPLTISHGKQNARVQVKIVGENYPLLGELKISDRQDQEHQKTIAHGPPAGQIWLGARAIKKIGATIGDQISIGQQNFLLSAVIYHEPDRIIEGHSVAMRALVNRNSLTVENFKTSRLQHRYLIAADANQQKEIESWASKQISDFALVTKTNGGHPLASFWKRTENFLGLASVILFFLAAIAIDMANRRFLERQKQRLALYLSFGQSLAACLRVSFLQWFFGFFVSVFIGVSLAYIAQYFLVAQLADQFRGISGGWHPIIVTKAIGLIFLLLLAFQIPMFWQLGRTSLVSLIRSVEFPSAQLLRIFWGLASISLLAVYYSDNFMLTGLTLGALGAALLLMAGLCWIILSVGEFWGRKYPGLLSFNFFIMKKRIMSKSSQILGLGLCSLLLLFTLMLMKDIGATMEGYARVNDGNLVVAELHERDKVALEKWAQVNNSEIRQLRPYASAKLTKLNGKPIDEAITTPSDSLATVKKSIRLSWSKSIPANNQISSGKWWSDNEENWNQISAEEEVLTDLGLKHGDRLTFMLDGKATDFELVASHVFKPGNGSVTFWFQVPVQAIEAIDPEVFYMGSVELPDAAWGELGALWRDNPSLSLLPMKEIAKRFDDILAIVTKLVVGYAAMVLIMTAMVIAASMKGFETEDRQKNGLLMSMGISKKECVRLALYDWLTISLIAGVGAIAGTWIAGLLIYQSQFSMTYQPDPVWLAGTMLAISLTVCAIGVLYSRNSLNTSITTLLND